LKESGMRTTATSNAPRGSATRRLYVTVHDALIDRARRAGLNRSRVFEESLIQRLREKEGRRWLDENREALEHHRRRIERDGM